MRIIEGVLELCCFGVSEEVVVFLKVYVELD